LAAGSKNALDDVVEGRAGAQAGKIGAELAARTADGVDIARKPMRR